MRLRHFATKTPLAIAFPALGDFVLSYGNYGHAQSNAFQTHFEHHYTHGLLLNVRLYLSRSEIDRARYRQLQPWRHCLQSAHPRSATTASTATFRSIASSRMASWDLPVGRGRQYGAYMSRMGRFHRRRLVRPPSICSRNRARASRRSGSATTAIRVEPGNIGISSVDAVGDFNAEPSYRPTVLSNNYNKHTGDSIFNAAAFGPPSVGADVFSNPQIAKRNLLWGPGTWGVNLGVHKDFHVDERLDRSVRRRRRQRLQPSSVFARCRCRRRWRHVRPARRLQHSRRSRRPAKLLPIDPHLRTSSPIRILAV